jgi:hypothetical protein
MMNISLRQMTRPVKIGRGRDAGPQAAIAVTRYWRGPAVGLWKFVIGLPAIAAKGLLQANCQTIKVYFLLTSNRICRAA